MSTTESVKGQLATTSPLTSLQTLIEKSTKELGRALPAHLSPERMTRIALTCVRLNPELANCTPASFMGALFVLAQIGLEPVAGRSYLIPFSNKRKVGNEWKTVKEVQAVVGYKGLIDLFYRHDSALSIDMQVVYANDAFDYQFGTDAYLKHTPALKDRGTVTGYYAVAKIKGGGSVFYFMTKDQVTEHAKKHSKTYDRNGGTFYASSPWAKEFDGMALKTVMIQLSKRIPAAVELQRAITVDETSRDYRSGVDDALDLPTTTDWDKPFEAETVEAPAGEQKA